MFYFIYLPIDDFSGLKVLAVMLYDKLKSFLSLEDRANAFRPQLLMYFNPSSHNILISYN